MPIYQAARSDAPDFVFTDTPVDMSQNCFYTSKNQSLFYKGLDSLTEISLGAINGYSYADDIDGYIQSHAQQLHI